MKIYTKTGDDGTTSLVGGKRVSKSDKRLEAYGTADELNAFIGLLRTQQLPDDVDAVLLKTQNKLFNIGACLATESDKCQYVKELMITQDDVVLLESEIDKLTAELPVLHSFILPAGNSTIVLCHVCRTIVRRLERRMVEMENDFIGFETALQYVNRLSDYLFILSKYMAKIDNYELILWEK